MNMTKIIASLAITAMAQVAHAKVVRVAGNTSLATYDGSQDLVALTQALNERHESNGLLVSRYLACSSDAQCMSRPIAHGACIVGVGVNDGAYLTSSGDVRVVTNFTATRLDQVPHGSGIVPNRHLFTVYLEYTPINEAPRRVFGKEVWANDLNFVMTRPSSNPGFDEVVHAASGPRPISFDTRLEGDVGDIRVLFCGVDAEFLKVNDLEITTIQDAGGGDQ